MKFNKPKPLYYFIAILVFALFWKLILILLDAFPFNSDEAIVGLMARHILFGERPIFFYGQAYMGSLDAYLVALGFSIIGQKIWVIRLVQIILYCAISFTTYRIAEKIFDSAIPGLFAVALLAIPTVNMTLYTTVSLGGYGEALLIGNLILLLGFTLVEGINKPEAGNKKRYLFSFLLGLFIGMGLWANGLTLIYAFPCAIYVLWKLTVSKKRDLILVTVFLITLGMLLGAAPWGFYAINISPALLISELTGSAVAVETSELGSRIINHLINLLILGVPVIFGMRPPWAVKWLGVPLIPLALIFWSASVFFGYFAIRKKTKNWIKILLLFGVILVLMIGFLFTSFGADPSGRYFLPIQIILTVFAGGMLYRANWAMKWKLLILAGVLGFNAWGTLECAFRNPPGISTQFDQTTVIDHSYDEKLIEFLKENGEIRGITNYWVSYPLAFQSNEEVIFVPLLPYHQDLRYTSRDNRYAPYSELVAANSRMALITTNTPDLDKLLRQKMNELKIDWDEAIIGDYQIFYGLSQPVRIEDFVFTYQP